MKRALPLFALVVVALATGFWLGRRRSEPPVAGIRTAETSPEELAAHSAEFEREVFEVRPGVHVAVGYGLANSILIEGPEGTIVIDTMASLEQGAEVAELFAELSDKPLRAIIYTHNHTDHVFGAQSFVERLAHDDVPVDVFAQQGINERIDRLASYYHPIITRRSLRMFGTFLDDAGFVNAGIGPRLNLRADSELALLRPTRTFDDRMEVRIAGLDVVLQHAPGESDDQLFVWIAELGVLAPGDNLYRAFPNLYTIRGTPYRDPLAWVASLDAIRHLRPEHLVPSHTRPLSGAQEIWQTLTDYRDGIQYVHDQTVRLINQGLTPDEIVGRVALPAPLADSPFLRELYGSVDWSVRSVFSGNLGWFDGNPSTLRPLAPRARAERVAALAGGADALREAAQVALHGGDRQWALELTDWLGALSPGDDTVRRLRADALAQLGEAATNPNARHYYLTMAAETAGILTVPRRFGQPTDVMLRELPIDRFMAALRVNLDPEKAGDSEEALVLIFPDLDESFTLQLRHGLAEVSSGAAEGATLTARIDSLTFKRLLAGRSNPVATLLTEFEVTQGSTVDLARILGYFTPPE